MASTLRLTGCRVDTNSITISFSEAVDTNPPSPSASNPSGDSASALNVSNYIIFAPNSGFNNSQLPSGWTASALPDGRTIELVAPASPTPTFSPGDWVQITAPGTGIGLAGTTGTPVPTSGSVSGRVPSEAARATRDVEDAISYPLLTEEVAYRPSSPVGVSSTGAGGIAGPGGLNLGQTALQAVTDVLGWKVNPADPKGFIGALTQSFDLTEVEGHVESKWVPRTYAVQTDLGGGITGAQASLYLRAKEALDTSLPLLDGLYPLDPDADPEYVKALLEMARSQMTEIIKEFGVVGLPSILRIDTYFEILLGQHPARGLKVEYDPDKIGGTLGQLRETYGIYFRGNEWNNSVGDEQDITNFRVISDYMTSLMQSWIENRQFFEVDSRIPAFFGTQLVLISRQFNVISETVNEVRFALDSVFIGPNERQMLLLKFADRSLPSMYLEDVLEEIDSFVADEGPRLLRDGGKISVTNNILPVVKSLKHMVEQTRDQKDKDVPRGFKTPRVRRSMDDLNGQLDALIKLTRQVEQELPIPMYALTISDILATTSPAGESYVGTISFLGSGIDPRARVSLHSTAVFPATAYAVVFYSAERIDVTFDADGPGFENGPHEVRVTNPDGESATLSFTFSWSGGANDVPAVVLINGGNGGNAEEGWATSSSGAYSVAKTRAVAIRTPDGRIAPGASIPAPGATPAPAPPAVLPAAIPQSAVTQEQIVALQKQIDELKASHESGVRRIEDRIAEVFGGKSKDKDKKSKDDD
jgi:hypothetical protein